MTMLPLIPSVVRDDDGPAQTSDAHGSCAFCGSQIGLHGEDGLSCAICVLVRHLERPRIDDEVSLVWLPELSQAALACLVREMHGRLRGVGRGFNSATGPVFVSPERSALYYAQAALTERASVAAEYLGTDRPSELAQVLARLPRPTYQRRHHLLGGLRVLPAGHFFVGADDVYPAIVDSWREPSEPDRSDQRAAI
jgi:hypothetical protein